MLAPQNRLLLWCAVAVIPFTSLAVMAPQTAPVALTIVGIFALAAAVDALWANGRASAIAVRLPEVVRLQKNHRGEIEVEVRTGAPASSARTIRLGLALPEEISGEWSQHVVLPPLAEYSRAAWPVQPRKRGRFVLDKIYVETASPLGFWAWRQVQPIACELRAYPDLLSERQKAAAIFLRRTQVGVHTQRQAGQGREFEKLREYLPGDAIADISWKATAKRGKPVTKVFQVERTHEVYVAIDASRLSAREVAGGGPSGVRSTHLERYVTAALMLGLAAEQQGDRFGLLTFSDGVSSFLRAGAGQAHFDACRDRLYTLQPQDASPDFEEVCTFIRLRLRKRALLIFLTSLDDPVLAESFVHSTELLIRQHLIVVDMLQPEGARALFADGGDEVEDVDDIYGRLGGHLRWHGLRELQKVLQRRGVRFALIEPQQLSTEIIAQHAEIRARQLV